MSQVTGEGLSVQELPVHSKRVDSESMISQECIRRGRAAFIILDLAGDIETEC
jgi:hypothetical protein